MSDQELARAVQSMQSHIEAHLNDPITLGALAEACGYSRWYSAKIFKEHLGLSPFEYIRQRRMSQAAWELREHSRKVVDVAFDFVFDSHEGFTRAFARSFGLPPSAYRKQKGPVRLFMPDQARPLVEKRRRGGFVMSENQESKAVFVQIVERPARKLILKRGQKARDYYEYCEEIGCEIWDSLGQVHDALYEPAGYWLPEHLVEPETSVYVQGVEVPADYEGDLPAGCDLVDLPAAKLMVFQGEPYADEQFEEAIGALWNLMDRFKPEQYGYRWADEDGPRFQLEPQGYRGYIEGRPVRAIQPEAL